VVCLLKTLNCTALVNRVTDNLRERFGSYGLTREGELDNKILTKELQKVASPDVSNAVVNEVDFERIMEKYMERFRNQTPSRVYCQQCSNVPEGFLGDDELRRHQEQHRKMTKKWICVELPWELWQPGPGLVVPLSECELCIKQEKHDTYQDAAAHLRRFHLRPQGLWNRTSIESLGRWIEAIEEPVSTPDFDRVESKENGTMKQHPEVLVENETGQPSSNLSIYSTSTNAITYAPPKSGLGTAGSPDQPYQVSDSFFHQQAAFEVPSIEVGGQSAFPSIAPPSALPSIPNILDAVASKDAPGGLAPTPEQYVQPVNMVPPPLRLSQYVEVQSALNPSPRTENLPTILRKP